jgi:ABC-type multidrug transport system fused ATPase/permease subunit
MSTNTLVEPRLSIPQGGLSELGRVGNLFYSPVRLFEDIRRNRQWWLPFVLTIACSYMLTLSGAYKFGFRQMVVNAVSADPSSASTLNDGLSAQERESAIETTETAFKISALTAPVIILLYNVLYAFALWMGLSLIAGGNAQFSTIFAVLLYADLVQDLRNLLGGILVYFTTDPATFHPQNVLGTNLAYYLDSDVGGWVRALLESLDGITIWYLVLISLGCAVVAKIPRRSAATVVFGMWLLVVATRVTWAALR